MMTNARFTLSKSGLLLLRRICSIASLVGTATVLLLMLFGFVSMGGRALTVTNAFNFFFYVLDLGTRSFISIVANVGFAIFYYVICVKIAISLFQKIKKMPLWFKSKMDSAPTRSAALGCVRLFDAAIFALCLELILSKALLGGALSSRSVVIVIALIAASAIIGTVYFYVVNRDITESVFVTLCRWLALAGAMLFAFLACNTDLVTLWRALGKIFVFLSIEKIEGAFLMDAFVNTILYPIFQLISLFVITKMAYHAIRSEEIRDTAKAFLKYSFVALAIIVVSNGLLASSRNPKDYLNMFVKDSLFILVPLFVFFVSKNLFTLSKSVPYMEDEECRENDAATIETQQVTVEATRPVASGDVSERTSEDTVWQ